MSTLLTSADNSTLPNPSMVEGNGATSHVSTLKELAWSNQLQSIPSGQQIVPLEQSDESKNRPQNELLGPDGKFAVGNPGGPGRPPSKHISEAYRAILERDGAEKYAQVVAEDALLAPKARDRLAAIQEMTDRVEGKAVQNIRHAGVFMVMAPGEDVLNAAFGSIAPSEDE